jgi:hypothetical protein
MTYTLRVSVKTLGQAPITGIDDPVETQVAGRLSIFQMRHRHLIVRTSGFASEAEAEIFLPRIKAGLWNIALVQHVAFVPEFRRSEITLASDPVEAGKNVAKSFGLDDTSPVHGLGDEGGYAIFRSDHNIRFLGIGDITGTVSSSFERVHPIFSEGVEAADTSAVDDSNLHTALSLYLSQFFESSQRARLLTLMMVLEVLAPEMPKHHAAVQMLQKLTTDIDRQLVGCTDDEERFALESLKRELDFRKETSIRRRVRELALSVPGLQPHDHKELARDVVRAYDLRGQLVHTGGADEGEMNKAFDTVFQLTKALLRGRLGLPG